MTAGDGERGPPTGGEAATQRLDKWLWFARVVKSRTLAASLITAGKVRVNKVRAEKPSQTVKPGDVVTSTIKKDVRVLKVVAAGIRRGSAPDAAKLYEDLTPPPVPTLADPANAAATNAKFGARPGRDGRRQIRSAKRSMSWSDGGEAEG